MHRAALIRVVTIVVFGVLPVAAVTLLFAIAWGDGTFAVDFHNEIYPEAKELLDGHEPVPRPSRRPEPRLELTSGRRSSATSRHR